MKEIILAAILMGAAGFVIGFAIETIGRASRRDAKRRNAEPPTISRWVLPYDPDDDSTKTPERGYGTDDLFAASNALKRKPRGRVDRDRLN